MAKRKYTRNAGDVLRRQRFVEEYLKDLNGSAAAVRAGYKDGPGIGTTAWRLLREPEVKEAIAQSLGRASEAAELTAANVLTDIKRLAGKAEAAGDIGAALRGRELLGKHLKLFTEKREVDVGKSLADLVLESLKKPEGGGQ